MKSILIFVAVFASVMSFATSHPVNDEKLEKRGLGIAQGVLGTVQKGLSMGGK